MVSPRWMRSEVMTVENLTLLPRPLHLVPTAGAFAVSASTPIGVDDAPSEQTLRAARELQTALASLFGFSLPIVPAEREPGSGAISLVLGDDAATDDTTAQ